MSPDEILLEKILEGLKKVKLEALLVGTVATVLQGAPLMTHDIDFFIRDTELNRKKIKEFAKLYDALVFKRNEALSEVITVECKDFVVDFLFKLSPTQTFESVRSRAKRLKIGRYYCKIADLSDIIESKKYADRPKDKAVLEILENTKKINDFLANKKRKAKESK